MLERTIFVICRWNNFCGTRQVEMMRKCPVQLWCTTRSLDRLYRFRINSMSANPFPILIQIPKIYSEVNAKWVSYQSWRTWRWDNENRKWISKGWWPSDRSSYWKNELMSINYHSIWTLQLIGNVWKGWSKSRLNFVKSLARAIWLGILMLLAEIPIYKLSFHYDTHYVLFCLYNMRRFASVLNPSTLIANNPGQTMTKIRKHQHNLFTNFTKTW